MDALTREQYTSPWWTRPSHGPGRYVGQPQPTGDALAGRRRLAQLVAEAEAVTEQDQAAR